MSRHQQVLVVYCIVGYSINEDHSLAKTAVGTPGYTGSFIHSFVITWPVFPVLHFCLPWLAWASPDSPSINEMMFFRFPPISLMQELIGSKLTFCFNALLGAQVRLQTEV